MRLYNFIREYLNLDISSLVKYTGMTDSVRANTLSFLDNPKFSGDIRNNPNIIAAFVRKHDISSLPDNVEPIIVDNPKAVFFELHNEYCKKYLKYEPTKIAEDAFIHPTAFVPNEGVVIGSNVSIGPNSTILPGVEIGAKTVIGPNCIIGSEGFHVFTDTQGIKRIVAHDGLVIIGKNVDLQASVTVDKGLMGRDTIIADECKFDNFVHIAHRVHVNQSTLLASGVCVAGSSEIGRNVWIGPGSIVSNRIKVDDGARILIGSVVIRNVKTDTELSGNFAIEHKKHLLSQIEQRI